VYSKTPLLGPPLGLRKNGLYSGVVLLLGYDKEEINEIGLSNGGLNSGVVLISGMVLKRGFTVHVLLKITSSSNK